MSSVEAEGATTPAYTGALADIQRMVAAAGAEAGRTEDSFLADVKRGQPENVAAAEYRKQIMAERANAKGEAERQRHMRTAEFFARWGSTPGPTLAAGLKALEKSIPDMISDEKEQKKVRRELDKVQFDIDNSIRLEERGDAKDARALKERARDRFMNLNERYAQILGARETAEISARASQYAADRRLEGDKLTAGESAKTRGLRDKELTESRKYNAIGVARDQERRTLEAIAKEKDSEIHKKDLATVTRYVKDGKPIAGMEKAVEEAQKQINERNTDWATRARTAAGAVDNATRRWSGEPPATPPPASAPPPAAESVKVGDKTYARPAGMTDAQWSDYKKSQGVK